MKLHVTDTSAYARIARIVVLENGLGSRVEIVAAQTRTPDSLYYAINPSGRVPYLVRDDGSGLEESALICACLDQLEGAPSLTAPAGTEGWEVRRLEASARSLLDGLAVWTRELLLRPEAERSPRILEHEASRAQRLADLWEQQIEHPLMNGPLNMAQITLIAALQLELQNPQLEWRAEHPMLSAWADRMAERPSIAATAPAGSRAATPAGSQPRA